MTAEVALRTAAALATTFGGSALLAGVVWRLARSRMRREPWLRTNYRGERIVAVSGILVAAVGAASAAVVAILSFRSSGPGWFAYAAAPIDDALSDSRAGAGSSELLPVDAFRGLTLAGATGAVAATVALLAFGWLGYRDDIRSDGEAGGFVAHFVRSWRQRWPTTGVQKALGGGAAAILCVQIALFGNIAGLWSSDGWRDGLAFVRSLRDLFIGSHDSWALVPLLRGAMIVALGANVLNLFDRMPGRATKIALVWWLLGLVPAALVDPAWVDGLYVEIVHAGWFVWHSPALWAAGAVGASVGLLGSEMREQHMQGDTGVNATGAVLALATVAAASGSLEWVVLGLLAALNVASERWSFSRIIDAVRPLRWLDRLGSPYRNL